MSLQPEHNFEILEHTVQVAQAAFPQDNVYMHKRIHSALDYLTQVEFEHLWSSQQTELGIVH